MNVIIAVVFSLLAATAYRAGGSGRYPRAVRVVGIPLLLALQAFLSGVHSWWVLLSIPLTIGAISTYWDFLTGGEYDNYWLHGFMLGIAAAPIAYVSGHWWLFIARCFILAVFMGVWCAIWKWDIAEETGRGFVLPATLLMIC